MHSARVVGNYDSSHFSNTGSAIYILSLTAQDLYKALLDYFKVKY